MTSQQQYFTDTKLAAENYFRNRMHLVKLQMAEKTSKVAAAMFSGLLIAILSFFILLFLSVMAGWYFAAVTGSAYIGFGIVSAFYIVLLILILILRKTVLQKFVTNTVIHIFFDQTPDDHEQNASEQ